MPAFTFTSPGGKSYTVNGPDGATQEQAFGILQQQLGSQPQSPQSDVSTLGDVAQSGGGGIVKGLIGLAGLPAEAADLGSKGFDWFTGANTNASVGPAVSRYEPDALQRGLENTLGGKLYEPQTTPGQYAQSVGEFVPAMFGGPESVGAKFLTRAVLPGVASEAAGQAVQGSPIEPYARVAGAVAGGGLPSLVGHAISPVSIDATNAAARNTLENAGVTSLTAGQTSGNTILKYLESSLGDALGAGNKATANNERVLEQFTGAALDRAGVQGATRATPDVMDSAFASNSNDFNAIAARNPIIPIPQTFWHDANSIADDFENLTGTRSPLLDRLTQRLQNPSVSPSQIPPTGNPATITGEAYQSIQSDIARFARATTQPELKLALYDYRAALDNAMQQGLHTIGNSADAQAWKQARGNYKNLLVLERAVDGTSETAARGLITPAALGAADKAINGRRNFVRGNTNFSDLSNAGNILMKPLPQSGTAPRAAAQAIPSLVGASVGAGLGGVAGGVGGIAGPALLGRAIFSRPVQRYLANQKGVALKSLPARKNMLRAAVVGGANNVGN